mmetsp:Transcript_39474/g.58621  ORF Transcript_39474/g.58621 Transcript_39474/m.58621 type:complete len:97 (-) Transcript_39474:62-352(-)
MNGQMGCLDDFVGLDRYLSRDTRSYNDSSLEHIAMWLMLWSCFCGILFSDLVLDIENRIESFDPTFQTRIKFRYGPLDVAARRRKFGRIIWSSLDF